MKELYCLCNYIAHYNNSSSSPFHIPIHFFHFFPSGARIVTSSIVSVLLIPVPRISSTNFLIVFLLFSSHLVLFFCSSLVLLFSYSLVLLFSCSFILLFSYSLILLFSRSLLIFLSSSLVLLFSCSLVFLFSSSLVLSFSCSIVLLSFSPLILFLSGSLVFSFSCSPACFFTPIVFLSTYVLMAKPIHLLLLYFILAGLCFINLLMSLIFVSNCFPSHLFDMFHSCFVYFSIVFRRACSCW